MSKENPLRLDTNSEKDLRTLTALLSSLLGDDVEFVLLIQNDNLCSALSSVPKQEVIEMLDRNLMAITGMGGKVETKTFEA